MSPFKRALAAWATLMGVFLVVVLAFAAYGERTIRRVEAQRLLGRSEESLEARRLDEAAASLQQALDVKPSLYAARRLLVTTLLRSGRTGEALDRAREAAGAVEESDRLDALLLLGRACLEAGQDREAEDAYGQAALLGADCSELHYGLAKVFEARGDCARFANEMKRVGELGARGSTPEFADAVKRRQEQAERLEAEAGNAGASPAALYRMGCLWMELGRWPDAEAVLNRCAKLADAPADAFFRLGAMSEARGDGSAAATLYRRALNAAPEHRGALAGIDRCPLTGNAS